MVHSYRSDSDILTAQYFDHVLLLLGQVIELELDIVSVRIVSKSTIAQVAYDAYVSPVVAAAKDAIVLLKTTGRPSNGSTA